MNRIVKSWNRSQARPRQDGPDGIMIDDERMTFQLGKGEEKMGNRKLAPEQKVSINRHSIVELVKNGPVGDLPLLRDAFAEVIFRLGMDQSAGRPIRRIPRGGGTDRPAFGDIKRWLDSLDGSPKYNDDRKFLLNLHKTVVARIEAGK